MHRHLRRLTVATIALTLLIVPLASVSIAERLDAKAQDITPNARTVFRGLGINKTAIVTNDSAGSKANTTYSIMPGNEVYIDITRRSVLLVTFSGESQCYHHDANTGGWCILEIWVNGEAKASPTNTDFAFGDGDSGDYAAHSFQRAIGPLNPGSYHVEVWWLNSHAGITNSMNYTTLTVQAVTQAG